METFGPVEFDPKIVKGKLQYTNKYVHEKYVVYLDNNDKIIFAIDIPTFDRFKWSVLLEREEGLQFCGEGECKTHDQCEIQYGVKKLKKQFELSN